MTEEELILQKYEPLTRYVVRKFMADRNMIPLIYEEDCMQEARIALIKWYRKMQEGAYGDNGIRYAASAIRFHLERAFMSRFGVHVPHGKKCDVRVYSAGQPTKSDINTSMDDSCYRMDVERWSETLPQKEQIVVEMVLDGSKPREIEAVTGMKDDAYQYCKRCIRKSYRKYFTEAI